jgi:hypothetical protein
MDIPKILNLLDDIIHEEERKDAHFKASAIQNNKASISTGTSMTLFYLRTLRDLIVEEGRNDYSGTD